MFKVYILVSLILFFIGTLGVILRKNIFTIFMSVELMLNSVGLMFALFARSSASYDGQVVVLLIIALAAAEASFGLALIVLLYRKKQSLNIDSFDALRDEDVN